MASGSWFLQAISILPECRGQGHANALLTKAEEVAKKSGTKKITLQV
ncbi:MAG: GNAT family N-acetyltransferase [Planktomarina sp.]|nr:GNAT family N-acetyltransferase [Planktomarina sp.]